MEELSRELPRLQARGHECIHVEEELGEMDAGREQNRALDFPASLASAALHAPQRPVVRAGLVVRRAHLDRQVALARSGECRPQVDLDMEALVLKVLMQCAHHLEAKLDLTSVDRVAHVALDPLDVGERVHNAAADSGRRALHPELGQPHASLESLEAREADKAGPLLFEGVVIEAIHAGGSRQGPEPTVTVGAEVGRLDEADVHSLAVQVHDVVLTARAVRHRTTDRAVAANVLVNGHVHVGPAEVRPKLDLNRRQRGSKLEQCVHLAHRQRDVRLSCHRQVQREGPRVERACYGAQVVTILARELIDLGLQVLHEPRLQFRIRPAAAHRAHPHLAQLVPSLL
mmetsp:Transcript_12168/g.28359  ORF Transcript_12168/g.28359 Transcript_12168/m.28359 type:complete len:344 (-) Transcript_12168:2417-3448(-)